MPIDPRSAPVRIAHLGMGAFHRAHQAWYTDVANRAGGEQWGIAAFTGRSPDAARALAAQGCGYDLVIRGPEHDVVEHVTAIVEAHDGADADAWRRVLSEVSILTLTITEAGYRYDDAQRADDVELLKAGALPRNAIGRIVDGLRARQESGGGTIAIVSCDNLDGNGALLADRIGALARALDQELAGWIAERVSFVSSVVDRITPAAADAGAIDVTDDPNAVVTEPESSWILAGDFPAGRPEWERAGAVFTDDIASFEKRKLWLLNAGHTLLANLGLLRGHQSVAEAMEDAECRRALDELWDDAAAVLPFSAVEIDAQRGSLISRFTNARIRHSLRQIATDSELKLRVRVVPVIEERLRRGLDAGSGELRALAAWSAAATQGLVHGPALSSPFDALTFLAPALAADEAVRKEFTRVAAELSGHTAP